MLQEGEAPKEPLRPVADLGVGLAHQPDRRALEDRERGHAIDDLGHDLDRARPRADHPHAPPRQVVVVIPTTRVHQLAAEIAEPLDVGELRLDEQARGAHEVTRTDRLPALELGGPSRVRVVPGRASHAGVRPHVALDPVLVGAVARVGVDLGAARVDAIPVGAHLEGIRVDERRHVDGEPRIGRVAPGPAQPIGLLEDHVVVEALVLELDRGADPGESSTDDHDVVIEPRPAIRADRDHRLPSPAAPPQSMEKHARTPAPIG